MLLEKLVEKQSQSKLGDEAFAGKLGISRSYWINIKAGRMNIGISLLSGAVKAFPELQPEVLIFLSQNVNLPTENASELSGKAVS